ncbi:MAG: cysteine--tRNA ligase [Chloroflexi bacterium]|nr:cysteine--tRNA ligase [Chloroflexota bacterium]MCI0802222.1 cysteine--tRNA ligase [Chloroflexota bacterium]MCI0811226.1 cysteine--tRNA ligase [Chloroflexota bacterium]MCI0829286.1 cysteine--tRNA ligase [Chloroflexota bacterium]MCI0898426.1 cysteine--tRNA ligase [Chloroflexota bacterium]
MKLYNTLTHDVQDFAPADGKTVKMYVCGVTPYSSTHVGHALSYVAFDTLRRYLEYLGFEVRHVQNFTDVDDKIIQRAKEQGIEPDELAEQFIDDFYRTMDALNIQRAHVYPRATQEISPIIETIRTLVDNGSAYPAGGDVFFRVTKKDDYGKLSHRTLDGMQAGARIEVDENKEHPMDFVLWKGARPGEPSWESPWGPGRPGWHIECTAMALTYLGSTLDIHGGGQDLVFPHHENEIAQSEASTGVVPFSRYWVHNGLLQLGEDKMSKSLGNLVSVEEALENYTPDAIRLYFLSSHYRSPLSYSDEGCAAMERSADRLRHVLKSEPTATSTGEPMDPAPFQEQFLAGMDDDLNTPKALAALFDLSREMNRQRDDGHSIAAAQDCLRHLGSILGLTFEERTAPLNIDAGLYHAMVLDLRAKIEETGQSELAGMLPSADGADADTVSAPNIDLLINLRAECRNYKHYALADEIRDWLESQGISVEDSAAGSIWMYRPVS